MDTFMDKLAQRLTAQEMIRANTAAETEEMNRLKDQVKEYRDCLVEMQKANANLQKITAQMSNLVDENVAPKLQELVEKSVAQMDEAQRDATRAEELLEELRLLVEDKVSDSQEHIHRECVKVYRNVQAVVTEESHKQLEAIEESKKKLDKKEKALIWLSAITLAAVVGSIAFQVLLYFHII